MPTAAISAFGTLLKIGDAASPEVFTTIAEVVTITGPALTTETIDVTSHSSASNHREKIASLKDAGELTFTVNYLPNAATHKNAAGGLLKDYVDRTARNWQLVFPSSPTATFSFTGVITGFTPASPFDDKLSSDVTITITAAPTLV